MAFLATPFLTELGLTITGALTEIGAPTVVAGAVSGAVVTSASNQINNSINSLAETLVGKKSLDQVKESVQQGTETLFDTGYALMFQDPNYLAKLNLKNSKNSKSIIDSSPLVPSSKNRIDSKHLAEIIVKNASEIATQQYNNNSIDPMSAVKEVMSGDNLKIGLVHQLTKFYADSSIPTDDYYRQIAEVYNGKSLSYPFVQMRLNAKGQKVFYWRDEVGTPFEMLENTGLVLPSVYGVFGGAYSINNDLPIDLADSFFCLHDKSAENGILGNVKGDYELVSRLSQNRDRLNQESMPFFNSTIAYFSIIASTWLKLKGSLPDDIIKTPSTTIVTDDFFGSQNTALAFENPNQFKLEQHNFYKQFNDDFTHATRTSSMFAQGSKFRESQLRKEFGNLMIQLL